MCSRTSGILSARTISTFSLLMTDLGTFAGATAPVYPTDWKPGIPDSAIVGTSGSSVLRAGEETPIA